jgi:phosphoenolpyruvate carboxykinase (diphosphate)
MKDPKTTIGLGHGYEPDSAETQTIKDYVNLKLAARGFSIVGDEDDFPFLEMGRSLLANFQERMRLLSDRLAPVDQRIHEFLKDYLSGVPDDVISRESPLVPSNSLILEKHGIARLLSLPANEDKFESDIVSSFRVAQGVIHNPAKDRRTTKGVFHVTEGGLPVPAAKKAVPKVTFAHLLKAALNPPSDLLTVPYTSNQEDRAEAFLGLLLRPVVIPEVPGIAPSRSMEMRLFAPGNLVSNLDFVETIFGNAGDPFLPENNAALDSDQWTGHTGCAILAPHLITLKKKAVGLPHIDDASERQKRDGMCWESEDELYNDGGAFKITCRDKRGIMVTIIADNYFGYCKKEVKTQISYAANLLGNAEEEHAGGAIAFPSFDHGEYFQLNRRQVDVDHSFAEVKQILGDAIETKPEGYAVDKRYPAILYVPETAEIDLHLQKVTWEGSELTLRPNRAYVYPSGYKVSMMQPMEGTRWRLVGTQAEGTFCHKPCTVSGGGKSEISKSLADAMTSGPVIIPEFDEVMAQVKPVLNKNFWDRFPKPRKTAKQSRPVLDPKRSLGSVLRLLTPNEDYTDEHNLYVNGLPKEVIEMVLIIKRFHKPDWGEWDDWHNRFSVDVIDGKPGYELKYLNQLLVSRYLRVGFDPEGSAWRTFSLRKDFLPAVKLQREDDITASTVRPVSHADGLHPDLPDGSYKFTANCEFRFFQRPDDAIHRGYDKGTEMDFASSGNFFSNYEPLTRPQAKEMVGNTIRFGQFTVPLKKRLRAFVKADSPAFVASSDQPRLVEGKPSKNPRYLQDRQDLHDDQGEYLAEIGMRLYRRIPSGKAVLAPVNAVLPGRRNNPPNAKQGIRALAVFNPIHYQELPELFMDFTASLTGKSPSTTGAGSEGALTKGPFNALLPITDLNNALLAFIISKQPCYVSAAAYVGPKYRVDHDVSLLVPEVWSRMHIRERDPAWLIENNMLEICEDFQHDGKTVQASRLGYRITSKFVDVFFKRIFSDPLSVFPEDMLRPELQDMDAFADGVANIVEAQQRVALEYFEDQSIHQACPPLRALLTVMAHGECDGMTVQSPELRALFDYETVVNSDWYRQRLTSKVAIDAQLWRKHIDSLQTFASQGVYKTEIARLGIEERLEKARRELARVEGTGYFETLRGTIGADPALG